MQTHYSGTCVEAVMPRPKIAVVSNKTSVLCDYFVAKRCTYEVKGKITPICHAYFWQCFLERTLTLDCLLGEIGWHVAPFAGVPSQLVHQFSTRYYISTTRPFAKY